MLLGNYNGEPSHPVTILAGINQRWLGAKCEVTYLRGCPHGDLQGDSNAPQATAINNAEANRDLAKAADVVIYVGGINPSWKTRNEEVQLTGSGGDRTSD